VTQVAAALRTAVLARKLRDPLEGFPLSGSGKIQRFVLREMWMQGECTAAEAAAGGSTA
jgi:hypothetical protein